jgi:hypothetical protein
MVWARNRGLGPQSFWCGQGSLITLSCAPEFDKSFEPFVPMVRIGGDALQVEVARGCLSRHGNSGTLGRSDARRQGSYNRGPAGVGASPRESKRLGPATKKGQPLCTGMELTCTAARF